MAKRISQYDRDDIQWDGVMRLIEGILKHILDNVSITPKWGNRDISMITLLAKRDKLLELGRWMRGWQWSIWVNIFAEDNGFNSKTIKRRFEAIRKKSIQHVNQRIMKKKLKTLKPRIALRSPSDKFIIPEQLDKKKQRIKIKKQLKQNEDV